MAKTKNIEAVIGIIEKAVINKNWSYAKLTKHLKKGENTLHRWRSGKIASFDIDALVKLFEIAGESMDETFGIQASQSDSERAKKRMSDIEISRKLEAHDERLDELDSMKRTFEAFSMAISPGKPVLTEEEQELRDLRAELPSGEAFRAAITRATKQARSKQKKAGKKAG